MTSYVPAGSAGMVTVNEVSVRLLMPVMTATGVLPLVSPTAMAGAQNDWVKPLPVMVATVPPDGGPDAGLIPVIGPQVAAWTGAADKASSPDAARAAPPASTARRPRHDNRRPVMRLDTFMERLLPRADPA